MSKKMTSPKSSTVNIGLVGSHGSGKTAILVKWCTNRYIVEYSSSIIDSIQRTEVIDGLSYQLNLRDNIDTDENYCQNIFSWADILLVVYSITSRCSFYRAMDIFRMYSQFSKPKKSIAILVANKSDLADLRLVNVEEGKQMANSFSSMYIECSVVMDNYVTRQLLHQSIKLFSQRCSSCKSPYSGIPDHLHNLSRLILPNKSSNSSKDPSKLVNKQSNDKSIDSPEKKNSVAFRLFSKKPKS